MTALHLADGRTGALRHGALRLWRDHPVIGGDEVPAWLRPPRRLAHRAIERFEAPWHLRVRHERCRVRTHIRSERRAKLRAIEKQIAILRRQDRRHRST